MESVVGQNGLKCIQFFDDCLKLFIAEAFLTGSIFKSSPDGFPACDALDSPVGQVHDTGRLQLNQVFDVDVFCYMHGLTKLVLSISTRYNFLIASW